ncbi:hypothetical protein UF75_2170 [Desulfosporosinus sp. I2]|nr:hypothetical protein UF75_2170 [Desulfosporosinus sp. I2]
MIAKLYNSDSIEVPVQWNPILVDTSTIGSSVYAGAVDGYSNAIKLSLTIKKPTVEKSAGLIAQYSTHFDSTQVNRTENIRLAAKALDGKLLTPGERFSFNESQF